MNRAELTRRVRSLTRDFSGSIFREQDIYDFINEAIDRVRQYIPQLVGMKSLNDNFQSPILLPAQYHHILAVYSASRCFMQDERHYQSTTLMNEFETKLDEMKAKIENGEIVIIDADGNSVETVLEPDYVKNDYFAKNRYESDIDDGVEGVE